MNRLDELDNAIKELTILRLYYNKLSNLYEDTYWEIVYQLEELEKFKIELQEQDIPKIEECHLCQPLADDIYD